MLMRRHRVKYVTGILTITAMALLSTAATAQDKAKTQSAQSAEKKTCRYLMPTGSIMATRVCNTAAAWKKFDDYTADGADQFRATYRMSTTGQKPN
jgi:hypothetical protein